MDKIKGYWAFSKLINASGFEFDNTTHHVIVDKQVWEGYVVVSFVNIFIDYIKEKFANASHTFYLSQFILVNYRSIL